MSSNLWEHSRSTNSPSYETFGIEVGVSQSRDISKVFVWYFYRSKITLNNYGSTDRHFYCPSTRI